jgi:hypothetical protein
MIMPVRTMLMFPAAPKHTCAEWKMKMNMEEDLSVGVLCVCLK